MNIAKNMEAIFFAVLALACATGIATASSGARSRQPQAVSAAELATAPMQVVTVSARRLTAAEKAAL